MILYTNGDVFDQDTQVIAHQVNCKGVMGAGLAKQVREHISEEDFKEYVTRCQQRGAENLGYNLYTKDTKSNIWIANCFAQDGFGANQKCHTDYSALRACLNHCKTFCYVHGYDTICIPDHLGCGLAGGNWNIVTKAILEPLFSNESCKITLIVAKKNS